MRSTVRISDKTKKDVKKVPQYIQIKLQAWVKNVIKYGIREVRKQTGWHDEPLKGDLLGQRSIRLSKAYRAYYTEDNDGELHIIEIIRVDKHKY